MISLFQLPLHLRRCSHTNLFLSRQPTPRLRLLAAMGGVIPRFPGMVGNP